MAMVLLVFYYFDYAPDSVGAPGRRVGGHLSTDTLPSGAAEESAQGRNALQEARPRCQLCLTFWGTLPTQGSYPTTSACGGYARGCWLRALEEGLILGCQSSLLSDRAWRPPSPTHLPLEGPERG